MNETLIDGVLDWPRQKADFERDGSLRDIYIQDTTIEDWKLVVARILDGNYRARLQRGGAVVPMPTDFEAVFEENDRHVMSFRVGGIAIDCHFFARTEIEFTFDPRNVTEASLRDLLTFMIDVGKAAKKPVVMTPENGPDLPIFRYDPSKHQLRWIRPSHRDRLSSEDLAELIVDALLDARIVDKHHFARAVEIVAEEIDARKALGDY